MSEYMQAITKYRITSGYREGWDRHVKEWVIIAPPPPGCSREVEARYRAALTREKAQWDSPTRGYAPRRHEGTIAECSAAYARGYAAGRKKGRAEAAEISGAGETN